MFSNLARWALQAPVSSFDQELRLRPANKPSDREPERDFLVGLSVGQGAQPLGVAVLERLPPARPRDSHSYACRYLRRWPPARTGYPALVADLTAMLNGTALTGSDLVVEAGPSIRAVLWLLQKHRLRARLRPVEVKASAEGTYVDGLWRVSKASLIETTRQVLQEERLVFDEQMPPEVRATTPPAQTIYHALLTYPYNKTPAANDAFASREGADDDLILSVALACWFGERCRQMLWVR
jgi:hypothetical protein